MAIIALIAPSFAEDAKDKGGPRKPGDPAKVFKKKDADGDGSLSLEEFTKGAKDAERAGKAFKRKDKDKDGSLSLEEFKSGPPKGKGKKKDDE